MSKKISSASSIDKDQILKKEEEDRYSGLSYVRAAMFASMYSGLALIVDHVVRGDKSLFSQKTGARDDENAKMLWSAMAIVFAQMIYKLHKIDLSKNVKRAVENDKSEIVEAAKMMEKHKAFKEELEELQERAAETAAAKRAKKKHELKMLRRPLEQAKEKVLAAKVKREELQKKLAAQEAEQERRDQEFAKKIKGVFDSIAQNSRQVDLPDAIWRSVYAEKPVAVASSSKVELLDEDPQHQDSEKLKEPVKVNATRKTGKLDEKGNSKLKAKDPKKASKAAPAALPKDPNEKSSAVSIATPEESREPSLATFIAIPEEPKKKSFAASTAAPETFNTPPSSPQPKEKYAGDNSESAQGVLKGGNNQEAIDVKAMKSRINQLEGKIDKLRRLQQSSAVDQSDLQKSFDENKELRASQAKLLQELEKLRNDLEAKHSKHSANRQRGSKKGGKRQFVRRKANGNRVSVPLVGSELVYPNPVLYPEVEINYNGVKLRSSSYNCDNLRADFYNELGIPVVSMLYNGRDTVSNKLLFNTFDGTTFYGVMIENSINHKVAVNDSKEERATSIAKKSGDEGLVAPLTKGSAGGESERIQSSSTSGKRVSKDPVRGGVGDIESLGRKAPGPEIDITNKDQFPPLEEGKGSDLAC